MTGECGDMDAFRRSALLPLILLSALGCRAQTCAWSHIDHVVPYADSGIWNSNVAGTIVGTLTLAQVGGALWEGPQTRFGKTMWQGIDAEIIAGVSASVAKRIFTRARPNAGGDPCLWFQGGSNDSFPSRETSVATALVTPYVLEYGSQNPAVYAMLALPLYVGVARIKNQEHWQSDVLAGWALGGLSGWIAYSLDTPLTIQLLPHGIAVGLKTQF
jgi:membrane-associated phospholipid phosphatase